MSTMLLLASGIGRRNLRDSLYVLGSARGIHGLASASSITPPSCSSSDAQPNSASQTHHSLLTSTSSNTICTTFGHLNSSWRRFGSSSAALSAAAPASAGADAAAPQREQMNYDVCIVGAGPAGLGAAIKIKQVINCIDM